MIVGTITKNDDVYNFSVDKFSYATPLVKIRYSCKIQDSAQSFEMDFSQYANISNNNPKIEQPLKTISFWVKVPVLSRKIYLTIPNSSNKEVL